MRSAGMLVCDAEAWPVTDLRVDWDDLPIERLHGLWLVWKPQADAYVTRALDPEHGTELRRAWGSRPMRFSFRQLEYFVAAGETGSVTRAAQGSHSSQPTVSAAIAKLEASLGVQLFVRHHAQGLSLTPEGRRFLGEAKALLRHASDVERFATALSDEVAARSTWAAW